MWYDKERIIEDADPYTVACALGIDMLKRGKHIFIRCPGHIERAGKPDRHIGNARLTRHGYYCESCCGGKAVSVLEMVIEAANCSYVEALEFLGDLNGGKEFYLTEDGKFNNCQEHYEFSKKGEKNFVEKIKILDWKTLEVLGLKPGFNFDKCYAPVFCYLAKPEEDARKTARLNEWDEWDYEWLVLDNKKHMSLQQLYREDYEAYLYLVISKAQELLKKIEDILQRMPEDSADENNMNLRYILVRMHERYRKLLTDHQNAESEGMADKKELKKAV